MEDIEDQEVRKEVSPEVKNLQKQIDELWMNNLIVEKGKSALDGFVKEFIIKGDNSSSPQDFLRKAKSLVVDLMKNNPQTKFKMILNCRLIKTNFSREEVTDDPFFHSQFHQNFEGSNFGETYDKAGREMIVNFENFNKRGSNWRFEKVLSLLIPNCEISTSWRWILDATS